VLRFYNSCFLLIDSLHTNRNHKLRNRASGAPHAVVVNALKTDLEAAGVSPRRAAVAQFGAQHGDSQAGFAQKRDR
jgi:DNA-binding winged helix-turn-helix (wHTH) protein